MWITDRHCRSGVENTLRTPLPSLYPNHHRTKDHFKQCIRLKTRFAKMVKVGDSIPNIDLVEGKPDSKVNLSKELGSGLIIGVPAAFSTSDYFHLHPTHLQFLGYQNPTRAFYLSVQRLTDYVKAQHAPTPTSRAISLIRSSSPREKFSWFP